MASDDDGVSRREMLTLTGVAAFAIGAITAESNEDAELLPTGGGGGIDTNNFLRIPASSSVRIAGNEFRSVDGIDWESGGELTVESGGLIEIADTA